METPTCPLCKVREREADYDPDSREFGYYSHCSPCSGKVGTRDHTHTHYGSPAQVAAGTVKAGHSWRTTELLYPVWNESGERHIGYRCNRFEECGWEQRFTPQEMEPCGIHGRLPDSPMLKGVCVNYQEHRIERGECDPQPRPYINDYGREQYSKRSDAANWDPGKYIEC